MGKFQHITNNFKTGEFSPRMRARTDLEQYRSSSERLLNVFPMKQGGANKRQGTEYVDNLLGSTEIVRTIPFIFSKTESYVIVVDTLSLAEAPLSVRENPNFLQDPRETDRFHSVPASSVFKIVRNDGTIPTVNGELGISYVNEQPLTESNIIANETFYYRPYPIEIFNLAGADPRGFHFAQSADVMILTHSSGDIPSLVIARTSEDTFEVEWFYRYELRNFYGEPQTRHYYSGVLRQPLQPANISDVTIRGEYQTTHRVFNTVAIGGGSGLGFGPDQGDVNIYDIFQLFSNRPLFSEESLGDTFVVNAFNGSSLEDLDFVIVEYISPTQVIAITPRNSSGTNTVGQTNPSSNPFNFPFTDNWSQAAWGNGRGFPRSVCFFEQRLILGGTKFNVDTIFGSRTGNIFILLDRRFTQDANSDSTGLRNFIPTNIPDKDKVVDIFGNVKLETDPLSFKPSSQEINAIQWLSSGQSLMVGTLGAEYVVSGANSALSATSITFRRQTARGGSPVMPVRIDDEVFYILRDGRSAYNFKFNRNNGSFLSEDVTLHADHIVDVGDTSTIAEFVQVEYCTSRELVLALTDDNYLLGFTYNPQDDTMAWHRHEFSGQVLSMCSIPNEQGNLDEIWVCVLRNGIRSLEKIGRDFRAPTLTDPVNPATFLDSHLIRQNLLADQIANMSHIAEQDIEIYRNGTFHSALTVPANGQVTLPAGDLIVAGLPFSAIIETNDLNAGGDFGSPIGNIQRVDRVTAVFDNSRNVKAGHTRGTNIDPIPNMQDLITGNRSLDFPFGSSEDGARIKIISEDAFPMTIVGLVARGSTSDR